MKKTDYKWVFAPRFRWHAFGWRSQTPIKRIKEAVSEIKKVEKREPVVAAEGAVLFLEKVSGAIEQVDSSSGAIGTAVNNAMVELAVIIGRAPADDTLREEWLNRLWQAIVDDHIPYLELLTRYWGEMCATKQHASRWADELVVRLRVDCSIKDRHLGWYNEMYAGLSVLYKAERYDELIELVEREPHQWWSSREWAVKALAAQGKKDEAIAYAEATNDRYAGSVGIAQTCEKILLADGKFDEAYTRYALRANRKSTNLATFRAVAAKYPKQDKGRILHDLVANTPGEEGKWFAAAKAAGMYEEAVELANRSSCDPKTLTRAARDLISANPRFAAEAGLAALRWLIAGYGYEITGADVSAAYGYTMEAAANAGCRREVSARLRQLLENAPASGGFEVRKLRELEFDH